MQEKCSPVRDDYHQPNYDPDKIAPYTLEDPLTFVSGGKVRTPDEWQCRRREILDIFAKEMYGAEPPPPETLIVEKTDEKSDAMGGFAVRTMYRMYFTPDKSGPCINWMLLSPAHVPGPTPVIMFLNYRGNHELLPDTDIPMMTKWVKKDYLTGTANQAQESSRGVMCDPNRTMVLPAGMILAQGFSILTACYAEVPPILSGRIHVRSTAMILLIPAFSACGGSETSPVRII